MTRPDSTIGRAHAVASVSVLAAGLFLFVGATVSVVSAATSKIGEWRSRADRVHLLEERLSNDRREAAEKLAAIGAAVDQIDLIASAERSVGSLKDSCEQLGVADCVMRQSPVTSSLVRRSTMITFAGPVQESLLKLERATAPPIQTSDLVIHAAPEGNKVEITATLFSVGVPAAQQ